MQDDLDQVPLDRDEELGYSAESAKSDDGGDRAKNLLFKTRLSALRPKPPVTVTVGTSIQDACAKMRENKIGSLLVVDGDKLVGIFTERDVLYKVTCESDPANVRIDDLMTPEPTTLRAGHRLAHALNKMSLDGCRHIPIVDDDGKATGVVSVRRIVDYLVDHFAQELLTLPPDPDQEMNTPEGG